MTGKLSFVIVQDTASEGVGILESTLSSSELEHRLSVHGGRFAFRSETLFTSRCGRDITSGRQHARAYQ